MSVFPEDFIRSLSGLLPAGEDGELIRALQSPSPPAVRFNPCKLTAPPEGSRVPWCRYGFYPDTRPAYTLDPLHHAGVYYVQEPSSMFIEHIVRELFSEPEGLRILDMCAAPGGKTTLLSTIVGLEGLVVANEVIRERVSILAENIRRWGLGNTVVTANDPSHFSSVHGFFDAVVVDAPCSGEGMFRKNPASRGEWSLRNVEICAARQKRILAEAWGTLKPGGILIYSTCTFNRAENEDNARWLVDNYGCEPVAVDCPEEWGIALSVTPVEGEGSEEITTYRFFPHRIKGEGFAVTVFRKATAGKSRPTVKPVKKTLLRELPGKDARELKGWVGQPDLMKFATVGDRVYGYYGAAFGDLVRLSTALNVVYSGVDMGRVMKGMLRPEHSLALFHDLNRGVVPSADVDMETALDYLRKKDIPTGLFAEGYNLVTFEGYPVGWVKKMGNRLNNLLPKELRIVNL